MICSQGYIFKYSFTEFISAAEVETLWVLYVLLYSLYLLYGFLSSALILNEHFYTVFISFVNFYDFLMTATFNKMVLLSRIAYDLRLYSIVIIAL